VRLHRRVVTERGDGFLGGSQILQQTGDENGLPDFAAVAAVDQCCVVVLQIKPAFYGLAE